jgi:ribosomal protein S27AE
MDREKVVNAVKTAFDVWIDEYTGCSWFKEDEVRQAKDDALSLLKKQEAVYPKHKERMGGFVAGLCPTCGTALNNVLNVKACGKCGQAVKWE